MIPAFNMLIKRHVAVLVTRADGASMTTLAILRSTILSLPVSLIPLSLASLPHPTSSLVANFFFWNCVYSKKLLIKNASDCF
jgi:hypothetical protein